jgi:transposase InsO family protein
MTESPDVKDHIRDLSSVFDRLLKYGIKVKGPKIRLGVKELPFLGTIVGVNGCRPDPEKTKAITELPVPSNVHHLRRFLGMASYYRRYIPNFADIAYPLYSIAKKNAKLNRNANKEVELDADALKAFHDLKNALTNEPVVLHYPHWNKPFEVHVDASNYGLGAVLVQKIEGEEKVIMYASRLQNNDEVKYGIYQKEALAMVWAIELFSHYLQGVRFTVVTDCRGLVYIKSNSTVARIARWILRLQEFDFEVRHRAGKLAVVPDELSREPLKDTSPYDEETVENLYKKGNNSLFDENHHTLLSNESEENEEQEKEEVVRVLTRSKTKVDKPESCLKKATSSDKVKKPVTFENKMAEEIVENPEVNEKVLSKKAPESCLKKAEPAAMAKKPVSFKSKIAEDIVDKDDETVKPRTDKWSAADTLERAAAFAEEREKKGIEEVEAVEKKRKTYFFGDSADKTAWTTEDWIEEQSTEKSVYEIEKMEQENVLLRENSNGIVVKVYTDRRKTGQRESFENRVYEKIYVPPTLRKFVLEQHHNLPLHGHQGATKLTKMIGQRFFWPGMRADAQRYTNACWDCVRRKTTRNMNLGLTEPALAQRPWETVAIDFVGKCKTSEKGNCWILTIIDCFSRYPILVPLPDRKSETVAKALYEHLICQHGCPKKILSDRAKEFISAGIQEVYDRFGIKMVTTAGYSPSANGVCERFHRWLNAAMTIMWKKKALDWDDYLPPIAFAYRASTNESTGYSPYYLVHGHDPILPLDALLGIGENTSNLPMDEIVNVTVQRLKEAFRQAREQQYRAYLKNYELHQSKVKPDFKKDDWIIIYKRSAKEARLDISGDKRTLPRKWTYQWIGPGRYIREISNTEAEVNVYGERLVIGYSRLARYRPWDGELTLDGNKTSELFFENEERKIEEIEQDEPEVGDMFVVLWGKEGWPDGVIKADFGVGKITKVNDNPEAKYDCHWYGSYTYAEDKPFAPGFVDTDRKVKFYNSKVDKRYFTNHDTSVDLTTDMILCFGDDILDSSGMLTRKTKEKLKTYREYFYSDN